MLDQLPGPDVEEEIISVQQVIYGGKIMITVIR